MKVENEEKVKALSADVAHAEQKLRDIVQAGGAASRSARDYAQEVGNLQRELKGLEKSAGMSGHKIMQLGQTMDDLQYVGEQGLRPIINNVMQLSPLLGMAMIAAQLLYTQWDNLVGLFGQGHVKTQAEEME